VDGDVGISLCLRRQEKIATIQPANRRPRTVSRAAIAIRHATTMPTHSNCSRWKTMTLTGMSTAAHNRWPVVKRTPNCDRKFFIAASTLGGSAS
jgi:hypothetical protein